ncbi:MAG: hypothetical protein H5U00_08865 [Clostridia bacterium]|nr:hypothetical protein [Clostridia bacterium]
MPYLVPVSPFILSEQKDVIFRVPTHVSTGACFRGGPPVPASAARQKAAGRAMAYFSNGQDPPRPRPRLPRWPRR